jgi:hypothetical protein
MLKQYCILGVHLHTHTYICAYTYTHIHTAGTHRMSASMPLKITLDLCQRPNHTDQELITSIRKQTDNGGLVRVLRFTKEQCYVFSKENSEALPILISQLASLETLSFAGCADNPEYYIEQADLDVLLKILSACTSLQVLTINSCGLIYHLQDDSPVQKQLMKMTTLTALDLRELGGFSDEYNTGPLERVLTSLPSLRHLDLGKNDVIGQDDSHAPELGKAFQAMTSLIELNLFDTCFELNNCQAFAQGLMSITCLHTLRMNETRMTKNGLCELLHRLCDHPGLRYMELTADDNWDKSVGDAWAMYLERNSTLQHLDLQSTCESWSGCAKLGKALAKNTSLLCLELSRTMLDRESALGMGQGLKSNTTLQTLYLGLVDSSECLVPILDALAVNTTLLHLRVYANEMPDSAATALANAFLSNTNMSLQYLDMAGSLSKAAGMHALCNGLAANTSLVALDLSYLSDQGSVEAICNLIRRNTSLQYLSTGSSGSSEMPASYPAMCILQALEHDNTSLQSLELGLPYKLDDGVLKALSRTLRSNVFIHNIKMGLSHQPVDFACPVVDALREQPRLHRIHLDCMSSYDDVYEMGSREGEEADGAEVNVGVSWSQFLVKIHCLHRDKLSAFLMLLHKRLGANSVARHICTDSVRAICLCYFGLPINYVEQAGMFRAYERVFDVCKTGPAPLPRVAW